MAFKRMSRDERRSEIMRSASEVIVKKGFANTTMEDIIAGTTLSKGGVYHYYSNMIEILRDLLLLGINYRNEVIRNNIRKYKDGEEIEFLAEQMVLKIVDDNPYMPIYIQLLIEKKRNKQLMELFDELREQTRKDLSDVLFNFHDRIIDEEAFVFLADFLNAMIMATDLLDSRDSFAANKELIKEMVMLIFNRKRAESIEK